MSITSYSRGHLIEWDGLRWVYVDNKGSCMEDRPCANCGKMPTTEGYDACLGYVEGATSACCGHGKEDGYAVMGG